MSEAKHRPASGAALPSTDGSARRSELDPPVLFRAENISKAFPGTLALDGVSVALQRGEVRAVVGPNGAGKSTLLKVVRGVYPPDKGQLFLEDVQLHLRSPAEAEAAGICMVYQELSVIPDLDVAENVFITHPPCRRAGVIDRSALYRGAAQVIDQLEVALPLATPCGLLSVGQRQMVEIARAFSRNARVLIFDEPTAALTPQEREHLFTLIKHLKLMGIGVLYVTHRLEEVFTLADTVTVIRDGRAVPVPALASLDVATLTRVLVGTEATTGRGKVEEVRGTGTPPPVAPGPEVSALEVKGLCSRLDRLDDITFHVARGEVVGIAGSLGSGRSELLRCIFGVDPVDSGEVVVAGGQVRTNSVREAINNGLFLVPGDRNTQGIFPGQAVWRNVACGRIEEFTGAGGLIKKRNVLAACRKVLASLGVKVSSLAQDIQSLSGGNQQKAILARALVGSHPVVLLLDDPNAGIDVGAKAEIREVLMRLASEGMAVVFVSSEFEELALVCHRVLVLRDGRIVDELPGSEADQHTLMLAASGQGATS